MLIKLCGSAGFWFVVLLIQLHPVLCSALASQLLPYCRRQVSLLSHTAQCHNLVTLLLITLFSTTLFSITLLSVTLAVPQAGSAAY